MKHLFTFLFLAAFVSAKAQIVNIPDANFKAALIATSTKIDLNNDKEIQVTEAAIVKDLTVRLLGISDLTGIEYFTGLTRLACDNNQLKTLDLSKNTSLIQLHCYYNQLTSLDLSMNSNLIYLFCNNNKLNYINVANNPKLLQLQCKDNQLKTLNTGGNLVLETLDCQYNILDSLNVTNNTKLTHFYCNDNYLKTLSVVTNSVLKYFNTTNNQSLAEICINAIQATQVNNNGWLKNDGVEWSTTCGIITHVEDDISHANKTKQLLRIVNPLGQEMRPEQAVEGVFIYQYSDGSTRKIAK